MIKARDMATMLGLSVSTIGRAMANDPRISEETKVKVRKAAEQVGYIVSTPAQVMRGGTSNTIGLVLPDVRNDFYSEIAQALSETCDREGNQLVLAITGDDREVEARQIRHLVAARAAGVIIVPTTSPRREAVRMLQGMPTVQLLRRLPSLGNTWFGMDDEPALAEATKHVIGLGHRRIAYIGGAESLSTGAARLQGFRRACAEAGILPRVYIEETGPTTHSFGIEATGRLLNLAQPPTAILTGSVHITLGLIEAMETLNVAAAESVSIVGFGDPKWFQWWRGGLTTIRPPIEDLATSCGLWFLNHLRTKPLNGAVKAHSALVKSKLVIRQTVNPPVAEKNSTQRSTRIATGKSAKGQRRSPR